MAGMLQWMHIGSSGKTGKEGEGQGVALYQKKVKCTELFCGLDDRQVERFLVRIKQEANRGESMVGVCYKLLQCLSKVPSAIRISFTQASFLSNIEASRRNMAIPVTSLN